MAEGGMSSIASRLTPAKLEYATHGRRPRQSRLVRPDSWPPSPPVEHPAKINSDDTHFIDFPTLQCGKYLCALSNISTCHI